MKKLFEYLKKNDLLTRTGVNENSIAQLSPAQIIDHAVNLCRITEIEKEEPASKIFSHCASISLAGGRNECGYVGCRAQRLEHLTRFAAFYSDRIYIRNFFSDYNHFSNSSSHELGRFLTEDIFLVHLIRPFLERGLIRFVSETGELCPDCLAEAMGLGRNMGKSFLKAWHNLAEDFLSNTSYDLDIRRRVVDMSGPELYYPHGGLLRALDGIPSSLAASPKLMNSLRRNGTLCLSRSASRKLNFHQELASEVVHNIAYHLFLNTRLNTSFLTDKDIHLNFLKYASNDKSLELRNSIAYKHLTTMVPLVGDIKIEDLLKLRDREEDSFLQFRARLNKCIEEFRKTNVNFTSKTARAIHSDIIVPELAKIEKKIRSAKRDLITSTSRSFLGMAGAISFGLFSGLIPAQLIQIAQAVGGVSFGADMIKQIMALGDSQKVIENEDLYFLWKVKKMTKKA